MRINGSNANKSTLMQTKHKIMPPPSPWYKEDTSLRVLKYQSDKIPFLVKSTFSRYFLPSQWESPQACDSRKDPRATPVLPGTPLGLGRKQKLVSSAPEQGLPQGSSSAAIPAAAPSPASPGRLHRAGPAPPLRRRFPAGLGARTRRPSFQGGRRGSASLRSARDLRPRGGCAPRKPPGGGVGTWVRKRGRQVAGTRTLRAGSPATWILRSPCGFVSTRSRWVSGCSRKWHT